MQLLSGDHFGNVINRGITYPHISRELYLTLKRLTLTRLMMPHFLVFQSAQHRYVAASRFYLAASAFFEAASAAASSMKSKECSGDSCGLWRLWYEGCNKSRV
jgi:hypothetical protein